MLKFMFCALALACVGCFIGLFTACTPPAQAPSAQDVLIATSYGARLGDCVLDAKEMDASKSDKYAAADKCICAVADDAGQASDPVLNCEGGAL